jgi:diaminopimelate decarboxylase
MNKKIYSTPGITRHQPGHMNAQAHGQSVNSCEAIDGVYVSDLVQQFGSPLYVFSESNLRESYRELLRAFNSRYPNVQLAWSYKTNYLKAICAVFHQEGAIAEVVSDFEYEKARAMGIPGSEIIFNGPYKQPEALQRAVEENAKIQIDNMDELLNLIHIAEEKKQIIDVAIRIYMDSGVKPVWSKFGFNCDTTEALQAIKRIHLSKFLNLVGLHTHVGTFILDPNIYRVATEKMIELAVRAEKEYGFNITYLNLGGGFASRNHLHYQYFSEGVTTPSFNDYADAICSTIKTCWPNGKALPKLYLETGRALVDEAGYMITTIVALKQNPEASGPPVGVASPSARDKSANRSNPNHGAAGYLVDSGIHLLHTSAWYQFNVRPAKPNNSPQTERLLYGCLCMNIDVIRQVVPLPNMNVGDQLVIHPVGAYNITQSMQFITYRPRVVMISSNRNVEVIRERENLEYIEKLEKLPEQLQLNADLKNPALLK